MTEKIARIMCGMCDGNGYITAFDRMGRKDVIVVNDCKQCEGRGYVFLPVVDKRNNSKRKTWKEPEMF